MRNRPLLDRAQLAKIAQNVPQTIAGLEQLVSNVGGFPSTIEEANALAGSALAVAQASMSALTVLAEALAQLESAPAPQSHVDSDDTVPRRYLGTMGAQDGDQVEITGGSIDNTPIGQNGAAVGAFTTLATNSTAVTGYSHLGGDIFGGKYYAGVLIGRSTVGANMAGGYGYVYDPSSPTASFFHLTPFGATEGSKFKLDALGNLTVGAGFGCNGKSAQASAALGPAATDLATTITLINNIRAALIANGIGA